jgi:succinate dehydrogenase flavin-adding protein (antitoxin of CptAB toxin-antitoxin module)
MSRAKAWARVRVRLWFSTRSRLMLELDLALD